MTISTFRLFPAARKRVQTLELLRSVRGPTQACAGCLACMVCEEDAEEGGILFVERWESEAAFQQHVRSEIYHRLLAALELSSRTPEVRFDHVSSTEGMELIELLRGAQAPASHN